MADNDKTFFACVREWLHGLYLWANGIHREERQSTHVHFHSGIVFFVYVLLVFTVVLLMRRNDLPWFSFYLSLALLGAFVVVAWKTGPFRLGWLPIHMGTLMLGLQLLLSLITVANSLLGDTEICIVPPVLFIVFFFAIVVAPGFAEWKVVEFRKSCQQSGSASLRERLKKTHLIYPRSKSDGPLISIDSRLSTAWSNRDLIAIIKWGGVAVISVLSTIVSEAGLIAVGSALSVLVFQIVNQGISDRFVAFLAAVALAAGIWIVKLFPDTRELLLYLRRAFFDGGTTFVSAFLILVVALHLCRVGYVETFVVGAPLLVFGWFVVLYTAMWIYEYWICRTLNEKLLSAFKESEPEGSKEPRSKTQIEYACPPEYGLSYRWQGKIRVHGNAGYVVVPTQFIESPATGDLEELPEPRFFRREALFQEVITQSNVIERAGNATRRSQGDDDAVRDDRKIMRESLAGHERLTQLRWLTTVYFGSLDFIMLAAVTVFIYLGFWVAVRKPVIQLPPRSQVAAGTVDQKPRDDHAVPDEAGKPDAGKLDAGKLDAGKLDAGKLDAGKLDAGGTSQSEEHSVTMTAGPGESAAPNLRRRLFHAPPREATDQRPDKRILLAASGGGTRAALFASSVVHGLHRADSLDDLVLVSGVSGGGVALAYYAAHAPSLKACPPDNPAPKNAWDCYHEALAHDYIVDVMAGITELRVFTGTPWGQLLAESFDSKYKNAGATMGSAQKDVLVILNSTLVGVYPPYSKSKVKPFDAVRKNTDTYHSGARLVFTNFAAEGTFPDPDNQRTLFTDTPQEHMKYVVISDPRVRLAEAAALNANFPPVFQNASIKRGEETYWVTDGGANDNRGAISLLYLLRHAIEAERIEQVTHKEQGDDKRDYPDIHVVIAEASRVDIDFSLDRGARALTVSKTQVAHQLIYELLDEVMTSYKSLQGNSTEKAKVHLHYLIIPSVLRMQGGMGTHWMPDRKVRVKDLTGDDEEELNQQQIRELLIKLHRQPSEEKSDSVKGVDAKANSPTTLNKDDPIANVEEFIRRHKWGNSPNAKHEDVWRRLYNQLTCPQTSNTE